jgi:hypothetical protein
MDFSDDAGSWVPASFATQRAHHLPRTAAIELTRHLIAQSRVIAKGERIRDVRRLVDRYGGKPSGWIKKSSPMFDHNGTTYEYHWYEHHGIGRFETKLKAVSRS